MSDLRRLAEKFGITRKRWFANLIESKGLTKIEDIEHELKHADENYLLDEAVEYKKLKESHNLEIVYISIDTDKNAFDEYYKEAPFVTFCDSKGWETQAAKDYHVFATPTYILLDKELKILSKIQSPEHLEAWLQANGKK